MAAASKSTAFETSAGMGRLLQQYVLVHVVPGLPLFAASYLEYSSLEDRKPAEAKAVFSAVLLTKFMQTFIVEASENLSQQAALTFLLMRELKAGNCTEQAFFAGYHLSRLDYLQNVFVVVDSGHSHTFLCLADQEKRLWVYDPWLEARRVFSSCEEYYEVAKAKGVFKEDLAMAPKFYTVDWSQAYKNYERYTMEFPFQEALNKAQTLALKHLKTNKSLSSQGEPVSAEEYATVCLSITAFCDRYTDHALDHKCD